VFAAELIFQAGCALGGEHAHGVIDIEAYAQIAGFFGDRDWRGHYEWGEDVEFGGVGQAYVNAAEIQGYGVNGVGLEES